MAEAPRLVLRAGRERSVRLGHPWILSGSVARVEGEPVAGDVVRVTGPDGAQLALADWDPDSQIRARIFAFGKDAAPDDESWLDARIGQALRWRATHPLLADTNALRLIHAEADGLPGLIVDRYADRLAVKLGTPAMQRRAERIGARLQAETGALGAWLRGERNDSAPTKSGGLQRQADRALFGDVPDELLPIRERGRDYVVDIRHGQKTGFYLDQRDARDLCQKLAPDARVLDLFSHTGGFAAAALAGGAREVVAVESSKRAVELLARNAPRAEVVQADVGEFLRADTRSFDLIVVDPPALAKRKRDAAGASRAYKDLNLRALQRAAAGAHVLTFSCSHHMDAELFRKVVFGAVLDAGRQVQVLAPLAAPPDHPVSIHHPQGEYLEGLLLRVVDDPRTRR